MGRVLAAARQHCVGLGSPSTTHRSPSTTHRAASATHRWSGPPTPSMSVTSSPPRRRDSAGARDFVGRDGARGDRADAHVGAEPSGRGGGETDPVGAGNVRRDGTHPSDPHASPRCASAYQKCSLHGRTVLRRLATCRRAVKSPERYYVRAKPSVPRMDYSTVVDERNVHHTAHQRVERVCRKATRCRRSTAEIRYFPGFSRCAGRRSVCGSAGGPRPRVRPTRPGPGNRTGGRSR